MCFCFCLFFFFFFSSRRRHTRCLSDWSSDVCSSDLALISSKKATGVCVCTSSLYGNAASRMSEVIPSDGAYAYGGYPDIDALFKQQAAETDRKKREALLHQIQRLVYERVRYGPIFEYMWPSGIGPRVAEPALMLINPYPWSAPLEDVRLKRP